MGAACRKRASGAQEIRPTVDQHVEETPQFHSVPVNRKAWAEAATKGPASDVQQGPELGGNSLVLAADVGGTNSRFMLYRVEMERAITPGKPAPGELLFEHKYANIKHSSFADVVQAFFTDALANNVNGGNVNPEVACMAVAGVAQQNVCRLTNLDWLIDGPALEERFNIPCIEVINDFVAQGYGVLTLAETEVLQMAGPKPAAGATIACVGAGTGLGQCFLTAGPDGEYHAFPSEGGHAEFAPRGAGNNEVQIELLRYLKIKYSGWNRISFERVVSGKGICNIYEFLAYMHPDRINKEVHTEFLAARQDAGIVAKNSSPGSLCYEALQIFADCYGAACSTYAVQVMPFGGMYISGGVTQKLISFLTETTTFMEAYHDKGRVSPMLRDVPLFIVKGDNMGQRGAHLRAVRLLHHHRAKNHLMRPQRRQSKRRQSTLHLVPPKNTGLVDLLVLHGAIQESTVVGLHSQESLTSDRPVFIGDNS